MQICKNVNIQVCIYGNILGYFLGLYSSMHIWEYFGVFFGSVGVIFRFLDFFCGNFWYCLVLLGIFGLSPVQLV